MGHQPLRSACLRLFEPKNIVNLPRIHFLDIVHEIQGIPDWSDPVHHVIGLVIAVSQFQALLSKTQATQIGIHARFDELGKFVQHAILHFLVHNREIADFSANVLGILGIKTLEECCRSVRRMISEFAGQEEEKLEVYLCPQDLSLLKAMANPQKEPEVGTENGEEGFASAIAGIFDGLDGDDALLAGYPNVKFFEDASLNSGDCQIKSRFGLLDGRIATKLRKIREELSGDD